MSVPLRTRLEGRRHRPDETVPAGRLLAQPAPPVGGEPVVARTPVVVGHPPFAVDQSLALEAREGGVERALLNRERLTRDLLNAQQHAVPVQWPERDRLEDQQIENARQEWSSVGHGA